MEVISPLQPSSIIPPKDSTTKFRLLNVAETSVETSYGASLGPSSPHSLSNISSSLRKFNAIRLVKASHAQIIKKPRKKDSGIKVQPLITSYLELGDFQSAATVFFVGFAQNYLYWNSFLENFRSFGGNPSEILRVFVELHNMGLTFECETLTVVLKLCANLRDSWLGLEVHVCLIKRGFDLDVHLKCALMNFYGTCWGLDIGLDETADHSYLLWNEAVLVALRNDRWLEGLQAFRHMQFLSVKAKNNFTIAKVLQACAKLEAIDEGKQIHGYILRNSVESNLLNCNSLISMYLKNGNLELARAVFDQMENRNLSTWNSIISGYASFGHLRDAWKLYHEMVTSNVKPDIVTWNSLLSGHLHHGSYQEVLIMLQNMQIAGFEPNTISITIALQAVSELCYPELGKLIHCYIIRNGLDSDLRVLTSLLDMYMKNNDLNRAQAIFDGMKDRNIFSWNALVSGYSFKGNFEKAVSLLNQMEREGVRPDLVTYNSMVSGYSMAGRINEALAVIREIKNSGLTPNVVSWTALISSNSQNGYHSKALKFCQEMQAEGIKPNSATIASLLRACAGLSLLGKGKEAHCLTIRKGWTEDAYVCTALIDMYSKCGDLKRAYNVFHKAGNKTLASWNSMIMGFSMNGRGKEAISLFRRMLEVKLQPDTITMTALLSACKHSDLVDEGWKYFDSMETQYGITPSIEHYSCMVDLLGKAGYLDEAWDFIRQMPIEPDATVWGAFLGSCRTCDNIQLGEIATEELIKLEPRNPANYILLMNMYAASKRWNDVEKVKDLMEHGSIKLGNVWSWIEIDKAIHVFPAVSDSHQDGEIYFELYQLISMIKRMGYQPDTKCVYQNIDEEEKEKALLSHPEKFAIAYGLIKTKSNSLIRVIKNTRTCADCHTFAKYVSLARRRHIMLKDGIRFHHFKEGKCSCCDLW